MKKFFCVAVVVGKEDKKDERYGWVCVWKNSDSHSAIEKKMHEIAFTFSIQKFYFNVCQSQDKKVSG